MREKYRKFTSIDEAREWGKINYSYWLPKYQFGGQLCGNYNTENPERYLKGEFSEDEICKLRTDAVENKWFSFYCGGNWGLAINEINRYGYTDYTYPEDELMEMQAVMDNRLNESYVPENIWGYRYLDYKKLCKSSNKYHIGWGTVIEDKGFMGVGLVKSTLETVFGSYDTLLKIMIPKGTKGLYMDLISNRAAEQELLCARGSKLKVLFTYRRKKKIIICKMLKPENLGARHNEIGTGTICRQ